MSIAESMLPEFDQEMSNTRQYLERLPDGKFSYTPHEKSMTLGKLAGHIVEMVGWFDVTCRNDEFDFAPEGGPAWVPFVPTTKAEALARFEPSVKAAREALASVSDEAMMAPWSLKKTGQVLMTMPRIACLKGMCFNHVIHHRGQLSVYLRANDVPLPPIYGPTADEGQMG